MPQYDKMVISYLKQHNAKSIEDITSHIVSQLNTASEQDVRDSIASVVEKGYVKFDPSTKKYTIRFKLNAPMNLEEDVSDTKTWNYDKILETLSMISPGEEKSYRNTSIPSKWENPYLKYLPKHIDQGSRGTCVGFSSAIGLTLAYYKLTNDLPTQEEIDQESRGVSIDIGCTSGKPMIVDRFNKRWKSPQYLYERSRFVGGVTAPSGSWVSASAASMKTYGSVFETECNTSKSMYCSADWFPKLDGESAEDAKTRIIESGKKHLIDGYATSTNFDTICEAIYKHGFVLIPINIFENYTSDGCVGNYPEPRGSVVGSHAQCAVGYDLDARTLTFRQSWGTDWSDEGGISERYFDLAASAAYIILDESETKAGEKLYSTIKISSNVPCTFAIKNDTHVVDNNLNVVLERNEAHVIVATPIDPTMVSEPTISTTIVPKEQTGSVEFTFTIKQKKGILQLVMDLIKLILSSIRNKK